MEEFSFLNDLYEREFGKGKPRAGDWSETVQAWGLAEMSLARYRLLPLLDSNKLLEFSSLTLAYEAARAAKAEREAREAEEAAVTRV